MIKSYPAPCFALGIAIVAGMGRRTWATSWCSDGPLEGLVGTIKPARRLRGVHLHPIHSAAPVPGQYPGGGGAGETQAQCHGSVATQHAREKEGIQPREHEERGCAGSVCVHHSKSCLLLMQLRLVVGSGPFYPFFCSIPFVSCIRLPACLVLVALPFRFDLEIARRHPGQRTKMCQ